MSTEEEIRHVVLDLLRITRNRDDAICAKVLRLGELLACTKKCPRCNGRGQHPKHLDCGHSIYDAAMRGCNESVNCRKCAGHGRVERILETATTDD